MPTSCAKPYTSDKPRGTRLEQVAVGEQRDVRLMRNARMRNPFPAFPWPAPAAGFVKVRN